jgi:exonuclease SbcD
VFADGLRSPDPWVFEADGEAVAVVAVPFLDPLTAAAPRHAPDGTPRARTHEHALHDALADGRAALRRFPGIPSVAVAHATVAGALRSDSEKVLAIGGAEAVGAGCFDGFDAVLLGHLHRPQSVSSDGRIAYSGSPLPYSFSETVPKSVRLVEICAGAVSSVRQLAVPVGRPVVTLDGSLDELLTHPDFDRYAEHWVAARLTDVTTQVQPMERLRRRFPHAVNVRYAAPAWTGRPGAGMTSALGLDLRDDGGSSRSAGAVVLTFLAELSGREPEGWERELVLEAVAVAQLAERS